MPRTDGSVGVVGFYRDQVLPRLVDRTCGVAGMRRWRAAVTEGLGGRVVEIGFGSGLNVEHYPDEVEEVLAVEPAVVARRLAARRIGASRVRVEYVGLDGREIPLEDSSCDAALSTFTLCTVPDPDLVLRELRRVLRPGGRFHFLEHGLSPDPPVARWQRRLDPLQCRFADGCHLTRDMPVLVGEAGFSLERTEQRYTKGPKSWSWFTVGVATNPVGAPRLSAPTDRPSRYPARRAGARRPRAGPTSRRRSRATGARSPAPPRDRRPRELGHLGDPPAGSHRSPRRDRGPDRRLHLRCTGQHRLGPGDPSGPNGARGGF